MFDQEFDGVAAVRKTNASHTVSTWTTSIFNNYLVFHLLNILNLSLCVFITDELVT